MPRPEPSEYDQPPFAGNGRGSSGGRPERHVEQRARSPHGGTQSGDALLPALPTLGDIERHIMKCDDELADLVENHYTAAEEAASAEADWKQHRDRQLIIIANAPSDDEFMAAIGKSQDMREAYAKSIRVHSSDPDSPVKGEDLYRTYKLLAAREVSIDRHIKSTQTRMTGLMAVARGIRSASGL